jgi:membrane protein DedA with SNARE-associated domain
MQLAAIAPLLVRYRYWILIPLSMLEGPMVAVATGALSSRGYFNPYLACWLFVGKDVVVDGAYYYLGRVAKDHPFCASLLARMRVTTAEVERVRGLWNTSGWRTMFVGKLAWGLSPIFLAVAGVVAVPADRFFRYAAGVALLQYIVLFFIGYRFGAATATVSTALRLLQYGIAVVVLGGLAYLRGRLRG